MNETYQNLIFWLLVCGSYVAFIWAANVGSKLLHPDNHKFAAELIKKFSANLKPKRDEAREFLASI